MTLEVSYAPVRDVTPHTADGHAWWWLPELCPRCYPLTEEERRRYPQAAPKPEPKPAAPMVRRGRVALEAPQVVAKTCYINNCRATFVGPPNESYCDSCRIAYDRGE